MIDNKLFPDNSIIELDFDDYGNDLKKSLQKCDSDRNVIIPQKNKRTAPQNH